jgi:hypothetical protein
MSAVVWSPIAERELDDLLYYIARVDRRPATGERIYFEIKSWPSRTLAAMHRGTNTPTRRMAGSIFSTSGG